jgi:hypothetical protein
MRTISMLVVTSTVVASVLGCAGMRGPGSNAVYTSPHNNFTVPVPEMPFGARIDERKRDDGGTVMFYDDFSGSLQRIDYQRVAPDATPMLAQPATTDTLLHRLVHNGMLPAMKTQFPGAEMIHDRFVNAGSERAYFCVITLPGGSSAVDMNTGERMTSTRSFLYFASNGFMYELSAQQGGILDALSKKGEEEGEGDEVDGNEGEVEPLKDEYGAMLTRLKEFKATIQITPAS